MFSSKARSRSLVSASQVRSVAAPVVVGCQHDSAQPQVRVVRLAEDLVEIRVTCSCGEEIALECELESPSL